MAYSQEQIQNLHRIASRSVKERIQLSGVGPYSGEFAMLKPYSHIIELKEGSDTGHPDLNQIRIYKCAPETIGFQIRYTGPTNDKYGSGVDREMVAHTEINIDEWNEIDRYVRSKLPQI